MDSKVITFRAFETGSDPSDRSRRDNLPVLYEVLTPSEPAEHAGCPEVAAPRRGAWPDDDDVDINLDSFGSRTATSGWTCATDSVRAQLESVIYGLPPPPRLSSSRFQGLKLVAPAKPIEPIEPTSTPAPASAARMRARRADESARAEQLARSTLAKREQEFARLDAERAEQIKQLTHRAEAAETKVRALEMHIAAEVQVASVLGRRFGQKPHELFPAFVARLGMTAKAAASRGGQERLHAVNGTDATER